MKIKGSTGGISRTLLLHYAALAVQALGAALEVWHQVLTPVHYAMLATAVGIGQSMLGAYVRTKTTGPLK